MARIPPLRRLTQEDFPDQAAWIGKLLLPMNAFFEQTIAALNRGLTLADNFAGTVLVIELDGNFPLKLAWGLPQKPVSVLVGNVVRSDGAAFTLASAVQVQWSFNQQSQLQIDNIVGVTPSNANKYKLTLEAKTG